MDQLANTINWYIFQSKQIHSPNNG